MPKYVWYDRRSVAAEEVQFFHESRIKHADKEHGTNMELDGEFPRDVTVAKIGVRLELQAVSSATARDLGKLDEIATFIKNAILEIQVGTEPMMFYPLAEALTGVGFSGTGAYTLATAADGTLLLGSVSNLDGKEGLEVDFSIPAGTILKFFVKQKSPAVDVGTVEVTLYEV